MSQPLVGQWSDALLLAEQLHFIKLLAWSALGIVVGTAMLAVLRAQHIESALLSQFAIQTTAWGALDLMLALWARQGLHLRDLSGAVALDRFVWLNVGLDLGCMAVGLTLALVGWRLGRRPGLVGAGLGVIVQGLALTVLDLQLATAIVR